MPTSPQFLPVCTHCKAFCCTIVRPLVTEKERCDILNEGFDDNFINIGNGIYDITPGKDEKCPYLKPDNSCEIQRVKPKLCRIWPVIPRYKQNKRDFIVVKCPLFFHLSSQELRQAKQEAETIPLSIVTHLWDMSPETKEKIKRFTYETI